MTFPDFARDYYRKQGWHIVEPGSHDGERFGFGLRDWQPDSFLAMRPGEIQIALVMARHPGRGAFGRLRATLESQGFAVSIVSPMGRFRTSLQRQGYRHTIEGTDFESRRDVWRRGVSA